MASAAPRTYQEELDRAVTIMEQGKHPQALVPLRNALTLDRSAAYGRLVLGTLYLQSGSPALAAQEFAGARAVAPDESLARWGEALAKLAQGHPDPNAFALFTKSGDKDTDPPTEIRSLAPLLEQYSLLINGETGSVYNNTLDVNSREPDALLLELAAFASLQNGNDGRAQFLLQALVSRPTLKNLSEDPALLLTFQNQHPAEGGAPGLPGALTFPEPPHNSQSTLTGRVILAPPAQFLPGMAFVSYSLDGGSFTATTNNAPFSIDWNTARLPNGVYTLRTVVYDSNHSVLNQSSRIVRLSNVDAPPAPVQLTPEQISSLRARLWGLLLPRPCRKAAHYALAELAVKQGDSMTALNEMETVCAIDPSYRGAYTSLGRFYREVLGPREGIWQARTPDKIVALTFDDGPNPLPDHTPALLDALKSVNAPATFFVVGWRAEQCTDLLQRMQKEGHEIANHSYTHPNLTFLNTVDVERELCKTSVIVRDATGVRPHFYRPPGGNFNTAVVEAAEALGMSGAYWTVDGVKTEEDTNATPPDLTRFVLSHIRPGAIILLHNAPAITIKAVPAIVRGLRAKGYTLLTMSDLVRQARRDPLPAPTPTPTPTAKPIKK